MLLLINKCLSANVYVGLPAMGTNVLRLGEGGDFYHKCSYEERMFVEPQNCHTKHRAANFL